MTMEVGCFCCAAGASDVLDEPVSQLQLENDGGSVWRVLESMLMEVSVPATARLCRGCTRQVASYAVLTRIATRTRQQLYRTYLDRQRHVVRLPETADIDQSETNVSNLTPAVCGVTGDSEKTVDDTEINGVAVSTCSRRHSRDEKPLHTQRVAEGTQKHDVLSVAVQAAGKEQVEAHELNVSCLRPSEINVEIKVVAVPETAVTSAVFQNVMEVEAAATDCVTIRRDDECSGSQQKAASVDREIHCMAGHSPKSLEICGISTIATERDNDKEVQSEDRLVSRSQQRISSAELACDQQRQHSKDTQIKMDSDISRPVQQGDALNTVNKQCDRLKCPLCRHTFLSAMAYLEHLSKHTGQPELSCPECNEKFNRRFCLQSHMALHRKHGPVHVCQLCDERFATIGRLRSHETQRHGVLQPWRCPVDGCGKAFRARATLEEHSVNHTGLAEFVCTICEHRFSTRQRLKNHEISHTGRKSWLCELCGRNFARRSNLWQHKAKYHRQSAPSYACHLCQSKFRLERELATHHRIEHPNCARGGSSKRPRPATVLPSSVGVSKKPA